MNVDIKSSLAVIGGELYWVPVTYPCNGSKDDCWKGNCIRDPSCSDSFTTLWVASPCEFGTSPYVWPIEKIIDQLTDGPILTLRLFGFFMLQFVKGVCFEDGVNLRQRFLICRCRLVFWWAHYLFVLMYLVLGLGFLWFNRTWHGLKDIFRFLFNGKAVAFVVGNSTLRNLHGNVYYVLQPVIGLQSNI